MSHDLYAMQVRDVDVRCVTGVYLGFKGIGITSQVSLQRASKFRWLVFRRILHDIKSCDNSRKHA